MALIFFFCVTNKGCFIYIRSKYYLLVMLQVFLLHRSWQILWVVVASEFPAVSQSFLSSFSQNNSFVHSLDGT